MERIEMFEKKIGFFLFVILMLSYFNIYSKKASVRFHSIDYPKAIIIPQNFENKNLYYTIKCKYQGDEINANNGGFGCSSFSTFSYLQMDIRYYDKDGKILPEISSYLKKRENNEIMTIDFGFGNYNTFTLFKNKKLHTIPHTVFPYFEYKDSGLAEVLKRKEISSISIYIKKIKIEWFITDYPNKTKRTREGVFKLEVNKTIKIKVDYEVPTNK